MLRKTKNNRKPILLGGLKEGTRSPRDYQQGYRVYDPIGIANALTTRFDGDLYLIIDKKYTTKEKLINNKSDE